MKEMQRIHPENLLNTHFSIEFPLLENSWNVCSFENLPEHANVKVK